MFGVRSNYHYLCFNFCSLTQFYDVFSNIQAWCIHMCHFSTGFDPWLALGILSLLLGLGCPENWILPSVSSGITFTAFRVAAEHLYYPALSVWFFPICMVCLYSQMWQCSSYLGCNSCGCIVCACRLLYIRYGLMGLNNITLIGGNRPQFSCVFIDPSGLVKDISVPFHLVLRYVFMFILFMMSNFFLPSCWH